MNYPIEGTWTLVSFELEGADGVCRPWGQAIHGLLIYTPTGHMSVSINKAVEADPSQSESENLFDSILFYSGTYQVEDSLIRHMVTEASNPTRIGREMLRYAEFMGYKVRLTTPKESFGRAILTWQRV